MQSTGWTFRAQSAVAAGTTSLTITKPSGTVDNDIMFMWLTHKGAAYATMPAGWTLIQRNISGSTRGELHWKRASGEGANYSVTGLADTALGMIASYIGGLLVGDVVNVSNSIANAAGTYTTPQVTPTISNTLILSSVHAGGNISIGNQGTGESNGQGNFFSNFGEWDEQLLRMRTLSDTGTNNGTDCRQAVADAGKPMPDITGTLGTSQAFNRESVRIVAAVIPDTTQPSVGTRYYMGNGVPLYTRINELPAGDWDSDAYGPNVLGNTTPTLQLAQNKMLAWHETSGDWVTNRQGNYDELVGRYVTPPLEAQTINGTIDISLRVLTRWLSSSGLTDETHAVYKLHVYITEGQTGIVRHVLLNNYIDATELPRSGSQTWRGLTAPQALTAGDTLAGDTIVVELGVRIISSPTPVPTYPPTEYSRISMDGFGGTLFGNNTSNGVGMQDSVQGTTTTSRVGWINFSSTITEQAVPAPPANDSYAGRTVIPAALPFVSSPLDTSGALSNARTVWFEWTPAVSGNVGIFTNGSNYITIMVILTGTPGSFVAEDDYQQRGGAVQRGTSVASFDAVQGTTYIIGVYLSSLNTQGAGELWMTMTYRDLVPAEGDLYIPSLEIYAYRDGLPLNWGALNFTPSGCVIDYSRLPLLDIETGLINTNERIVLNAFGGSTLTEILDLDTLDRNEAEVDFIFDAWSLAGDPQNAAALAYDRVNSLVITLQWGTGFLDVNDSGTTGSLAAFFNDVSEFADESAVYRTSIQNGDNTGAPVVAAEQFSGLTVDATTAWYGAVADEDGSILYYVSDGFYIAPRNPPATLVIRAYNLTTATQLPDVATIPASSSPAAGSGLHGLCVFNDGTLFVCNGNTVHRVDIATGAILTTYTAVGDFGYDGQDLTDVRIMPDGQTIVAIDGHTMTVFEWDIASGVQVDYFQTWLTQGNFTQFAIYQPNPFPGLCIGERGLPIVDGLPYDGAPTIECLAEPGGDGTRAQPLQDGLPYDPTAPASCGGTGTRGAPPTGA